MLVKLSKNFFAPNGRLYRKDVDGTDVPDEFQKMLPADSQVLSTNNKKSVTPGSKKTGGQTSREASQDLKAQKAVDEILQRKTAD